MPNFSRISPMPPYFIVKVNKLEQQKRREMIGNIYLSPSHTFMTRELQGSEIVEIGTAAHDYFPEAKIGDFLLYHHFITGKTDERKHLFYFVDEDGINEYYVVTAMAIPGEKNMCYGVWNGKEIIPNPDYIFLEIPKEEEGDNFEMEFNGEKVVTNIGFDTSAGGLVIPKERKKTRKQCVETMQKNKDRLLQISVPKRMTDEVFREIKRLEAENYAISKEINKKSYELHTVAFANPNFFEFGDEQIVSGSKIYMLNMACHYEIEFREKSYIVAEVKYFGCSENWLHSSYKNFKNGNPNI